MVFTVESKYPISFFEDNDVECTWNTISVGWNLNRITSEEIGKFALQYLKKNPNTIDENISELIFGVKNHEIDSLIEKIFISINLKKFEKNSLAWDKEWAKWRYCILREMLKHSPNDEKLLEYVAGVYADFGYPEDMKHFIYYMPQENTNEQLYVSSEDRQKQLVENLKNFLLKEKKSLIKF